MSINEKTCILCGKEAKAANFIVTGPNNNCLCDECIAMCSSVANQAYLNIFCSDEEFAENEHGEVWFGKQPKSFFGNPENENLKQGEDKNENSVLPQEEIDSLIDFLEFDGQFDDESFDPTIPYDSESLEEMIEKDLGYKSKDELIFDNKLTPKEIKAYLDRFVIGQEQAKKVISVAVYNHFKRLKDKTGLIRKSNILLAGPSGSGKTLLAETLAKLMDVPFAIADATSLTEAGYVGDDVENVITRLLDAANGNVKKAEIGIVFIDEIDKIARSSGNRSITRDVSGEGVQQSLLKIIEGDKITVPVEGGRKHPYGNNVTVDTSNILFICGGAFEGIGEKKKKSSKVGFLAGENVDLEGISSLTSIDEKVTTEEFIKFGMMPEFMGRLPVVVTLSELTEEELVRVLTEPENSLIKGYEALFEQDGVKLTFDKEALNELARIAIQRKIGARGLRGIVEEVMLDIMFERPSIEDGISECIITKDTIYSKMVDLKLVA